MWFWPSAAALILLILGVLAALGSLGSGSAPTHSALRQNHDTSEAVFLFKGLLFQVFTGVAWANGVYEHDVGYSLLPLAPLLGYAVWNLYLRREGDSPAEHPRAAWLLSLNAASLGIAAVWLGSGTPLFALPLLAPIAFCAMTTYSAEDRFFPLLVLGTIAIGQVIALLATSISASVFEVPELNLSATEAGIFSMLIIAFAAVQWYRSNAELENVR